MNYLMGNDLFIEMMNWDFIEKKNQFNTDVFMNEPLTGPVPLKKSPTLINVFNQYALVVNVNDQLQPEPEMNQGFGFNNNKAHYTIKKNPYDLF